MRAMECPLEVHPEQGLTDEQLRSIIEENVYEK
jgi:hypothetical protein